MMPAAQFIPCGGYRHVNELGLQGWKCRSNHATLLQGCYMVSRGRHQHNEINAAFKVIRKTRSLTVVEIHKGHRWGAIECVCGGDPYTVWCTPRNPGNHARGILRYVNTHAACADSEDGS
ncbi:hypothetical protein SAMN05421869_116182 [Nonomuraea jiangxiensis]|uniref:Uncharacterized protein n=1 Tax=Nonomuraea jiangxiensis TaxID=633440 RepID=A0A1G9CII6_9ACTN|nr:hypothetical protein SAMN05421869_116182 [Nonomuraea jiangxiensis]